MDQQYNTEVVCPLSPPSPGWDSLKSGEKPVVARLIRYFTQIPNFISGAHITLPSDKSICVALFPLENYEVTAQFVRQILVHTDLSADILNVECDTQCRALLNPDVVGAIMVYLRTAQYNNAHPGTSRRYADPSTTAASGSMFNLAAAPFSVSGGVELQMDTPRSMRLRRSLPGVVKDERHKLDDLGNQLLLLQGAQFQPATQSVLRLSDCRYELRTFGFVRPLTVEQLETAASMPFVQRSYLNFHMSCGRECGALVVVCQLPRAKRTQGAAELNNESADRIASIPNFDVGADADADADSDSKSDADSDDDLSMRHRHKRTAPASGATADGGDDNGQTAGATTTTDGGGGGAAPLFNLDWIKNLFS